MPDVPKIPSTSPYKVLSDVFEKNKDSILEIEVLGSEVPLPEGQLILQDGLCVGIPKKVLAKAFVEARAIFMTRNHERVENEAILAATKVILLFDPEYLTASNYRKERFAVCAGRLGELTERRETVNSCRDTEMVDQELMLEMNFLDSILTSPLHRQTKSPTLWYHRFWIVSSTILPLHSTTLLGTGSRPDFHETKKRRDLQQMKDLLEREMAVVFKAAERHPHNYYAWQYLRRLLEVFTDEELPEYFATQKFNVSLKIRSELPIAVLSWCLANPSDASGWSFLTYFVYSRWLAPTPEKTDEIILHVMQFIMNVRWMGEAVWTFLKLAPRQSTERFRDAILEFGRAVQQFESSRHVEKAIAWMEKDHSDVQMSSAAL
ncbi:hypothetical protein NA57DRAFT_74075 [Rhizodiscina lignyota]|uniref:Protein prenylyltransferase n=1 Tax=Rhizodiscina lignyota TaxID=1504668 RepID=A0A9P4M794_9PEZI|nr:hypothetical protein NA57DRAFT_74075 [Rhizodiscina lignyota]